MSRSGACGHALFHKKGELRLQVEGRFEPAEFRIMRLSRTL